MTVPITFRSQWPLWKRLLGFPPPWDTRADIIYSRICLLTNKANRLRTVLSPEWQSEAQHELARIEARINFLKEFDISSNNQDME